MAKNMNFKRFKKAEQIVIVDRVKESLIMDLELKHKFELF
jgi:hypothetical protein